MNVVYNMDNMEYMKDIENNYFELAIVDPPYGIFDEGKKMMFSKGMINEEKKEISKWDIKPGGEYFKELFRISQNQIIWGGNYFLDFLSSTKGMVVWQKLNPGLPFADGEIAWCSYEKPVKIFILPHFGYMKSVVKKQDGKSIHPTQKPVALYTWLLETYAKKGDKIFDSHVGSGSSRIACYRLGFDFFGVELNQGYWKAQEKRFEFEKAKNDNNFYLLEENNLFRNVI